MKYKDVAVDLPLNPTAAGFRHGTSDTLACHVPAEIAVHTTGHDLTNLGALWEYLGARVALLIPSAITLAGFPPLPYGQMGEGPAHPSLTALTEWGVVTLPRLDAYLDMLFAFHDHDHAPPWLYVGNPLRERPPPTHTHAHARAHIHTHKHPPKRTHSHTPPRRAGPMMHATLASMIMWYKERFAAKEMGLVLEHMRDVFVETISKTEDPHATLLSWGAKIRCASPARLSPARTSSPHVHAPSTRRTRARTPPHAAISRLLDAAGSSSTLTTRT